MFANHGNISWKPYSERPRTPNITTAVWLHNTILTARTLNPWVTVNITLFNLSYPTLCPAQLHTSSVLSSLARHRSLRQAIINHSQGGGGSRFPFRSLSSSWTTTGQGGRMAYPLFVSVVDPIKAAMSQCILLSVLDQLRIPNNLRTKHRVVIETVQAVYY